jgi:streptogramin lyase
MTNRFGRRTATAILALTMASGWFGSGAAMAQTVTEFPLPTANAGPAGITLGPDGALWFVEYSGNKIGRITTGGTITEFPLPAHNYGSNGGPQAIVTGSDGNLWYLINDDSGVIPQPIVGRMTPQGVVAEFPVPIAQGTQPFAHNIAPGPDGALWFTLVEAAVGRITVDGTITILPVVPSAAHAVGITAGPDGALWFTDASASAAAIGRITPTGVASSFGLPTKTANPQPITKGPDGALWFGERSAAAIGRITTGGAISEFPMAMPTSASQFGTAPRNGAYNDPATLWARGTYVQPIPQSHGGPAASTVASGMIIGFMDPGDGAYGAVALDGTIVETAFPNPNTVSAAGTLGPDGASWFTDGGTNAIGRFAPAVTAPTSLVAAVLPSSRSLQVGGTPGTVFATVINSGAINATGCAIVPVTTVAAGFSYQTTDPATNAPTGTPNTPVDIAAGAAQTFVLSFTPNAAFVPINALFGIACSNIAAGGAAPATGVDTLLISASVTPVPDIVALAATPSHDGIVDLPGSSGADAFSIATVNLGAGGAITASVNTGTAQLPISLSICATNPSSGQCLAAPAASVTTTIAGDATPTFAVFVGGAGTVPFDPAGNRIFVSFADAGGAIRGSTSVAVRTQ